MTLVERMDQMEQTTDDANVPADPRTPPAPDAAGGLRIGELLVRQGVLTRPQLAHALDVQAATGRPLGDLAERLFGVPAPAVRAAWAEQFALLHGERDVAGERVDPACAALLTARQAWQFRLVPLRRELDGDEGAGHLLIAAGRRGLRRGMTFAVRSLPAAPSFALATASSLDALLGRVYPVPGHVRDWACGR